MSCIKCETCKEHFDIESTRYKECPNCGSWICENCFDNLLRKHGNTKDPYIIRVYGEKYTKTTPALCGKCEKLGLQKHD